MTHEVAQAEVADHAGVAFHPPVLLLFALVLGFGARWLSPLRFLPDVAATPLGPVAVAASFGWFLWAVVTMRGGGGSIPTSEPTEAIVRQGPYRWSRNPVRLEFQILSLNAGRRQRCVPPIVCPTLSRVWKLSCSPCSTWPSRPQSSVGPAACEP